jgi:hypothetical protein
MNITAKKIKQVETVRNIAFIIIVITSGGNLPAAIPILSMQR